MKRTVKYKAKVRIKFTMKKVVLKRNPQDSSGTFGILWADQFKYYTVERPWLDNKEDVSCIPTGIYVCKWTHSPRLDKFTYEVQNVEGRSGIRIHSANYPEEVLGCIALGHVHGLNAGRWGVFGSKDAVREFNEHMNQEDFELEIIQEEK